MFTRVRHLSLAGVRWSPGEIGS